MIDLAMKLLPKIALGCGVFVVVLIAVGVVLFMGACKVAKGVPGFFKTEPEYEVTSGKVYYVTYQGTGLGNVASRRLVEGADGSSFKTISPGKYAKDAKHIICDGSVLPGSDSKTFKLLDDQGHYGKDAHQVYCGGVIEGADAASFEFVNGLPKLRDNSTTIRVAKDKKDYYLGREPLRIRELASFKISDEDISVRDIWAHDKFNYYVLEKASPIADAATFQVLRSGFAKDAKQAYFLSGLIEGADPQTFEAFADDYAKDAKRVYHCSDRILEPKTTVMELADAATFNGLKSGWAKDAKQVFHNGGLVPDADAMTFVALDYDYGKDAKNAFYGNQVIQDADLATFQIVGPGNSLGSGYAKDKNNVYFGLSSVLGADAATFQAIEGKAWDKNNIYFGAYGKPISESTGQK